MKLKIFALAAAFFLSLSLYSCSAAAITDGEKSDGEKSGISDISQDAGTILDGDMQETEEKTETEENNEETEKNTEEAVYTEAAETEAEYIECLYDGLNIRSGAGTSFASLGKAEKGTLYPCSGSDGGWYKTLYKNREAYVSAQPSYTKIITLPVSDGAAESVIEEAYKLIGTKYVYGAVRLHDGSGNLNAGFDATKFDCSSLVQYVFYYGAGLNLSSTTRTQILEGEYVNPSELRRGDCIFFTNDSRKENSGIERVGHVAVWLGGGYILHTASDYCKIELMTEKRWNYYIEARRFV